MNQSGTGQRDRRGRMRRRLWPWIAATGVLTAGLVAMYLYQKSLEDDLEAMLRSALQRFEAELADPDGREEDAPAADEPAERG